jgi:uroporphyrinogen-III synthase
MRRPAVLVVRPEGRFSEVLRENGCEVVNLELIKTESVVELSELVNTVQQIENYDGIFFTSPVAAEIFLRQLTFEGRKFPGKFYVLGERAKAVFDGSGLDVISSVAANTARDLIESIDKANLAGKNLLFICGDRSIRTIPEMLGGIARVDELVVYKTVEISPDDSVIENVKAGLETDDIGWACFFSPSGVNGFLAHFGGEGVAKVKAAAIGETTARRADEVGLDVSFISERANAEDFATGFAAYIRDIE